MNTPIVASASHKDAPWIAANLAVLDEGAGHVLLDINLDLLGAERARDQKLVRHSEDATVTLVTER